MAETGGEVAYDASSSSAQRSAILLVCIRALSLVGLGAPEYPRFSPRVSNDPGARLLEFPRRGFHAGGGTRTKGRRRWNFFTRIAPVWMFTRRQWWLVFDITCRTERQSGRCGRSRRP